MSRREPDDDARGSQQLMGRRALLAAAATGLLAACAAPATSSGRASATSRTSPPTSGRVSGSPSAGPTADRARGGPAKEVVHGPRGVAAVALTFHGAGDPALAARVLDIARSHGAHLTVLAVGTWLVSAPEAARRVLAEGHELGNHTLHHRPMAHMDAAMAYVEIEGGRREVSRFVHGPSWFRPSGTPHATPAILAAAGRAGYATSLSFDVDPRDYQDPGAAVVSRRVLGAVRRGSIVSLHLGHAGTAAALPTILDGLAARGLAAVTVSDLLIGVRP